MKNQFLEYHLSDEIIEALTLLGYTKPTEVQKDVIPMALKGRDIVAKSQTGTGKTAAFSIPICESIQWEENLPQALILEPTRELAVQVKEEIFYIGRKKRLKIPAVFGGVPIDRQIQTLRQKTHIIVGTPGRVMDHIRRGSLNPEKIEYFIIDEADLMLDMGFLEDVKQIMDKLPDSRQTMLFSATLEEEVRSLADDYMKNPVEIIKEEKEETVLEIEQFVYEAEPEEKYKVLLSLLIQENPEEGMIFCATREMVNVLYRKMKKDHISCGMIHGELDQRERLKTIQGFRTGSFRYLIATDVAARGIDFEEMPLVINYDFPRGRETYVHRVGRTGRNGSFGKAVSLVGTEEKKMLKTVESYIGKEIMKKNGLQYTEKEEQIFWRNQKKKLAPKTQKGDALNQSISNLIIGGGKKSKMRAVDIVGALCNIDNMNASDIGIIDIRESMTNVEVLHGKGDMVFHALQTKPVKGKIRKVKTRKH